jgi:hypothetical protein
VHGKITGNGTFAAILRCCGKGDCEMLIFSTAEVFKFMFDILKPIIYPDLI